MDAIAAAIAALSDAEKQSLLLNMNEKPEANPDKGSKSPAVADRCGSTGQAEGKFSCNVASRDQPESPELRPERSISPVSVSVSPSVSHGRSPFPSSRSRSPSPVRPRRTDRNGHDRKVGRYLNFSTEPTSPRSPKRAREYERYEDSRTPNKYFNYGYRDWARSKRGGGGGRGQKVGGKGGGEPF
mmetsp:Transcript_49758/g.88985  ORF Transcript_49758/g.88985 Transcript_49758/m.88985 type:complete len:185 (-) Transcript_49758:10-564(-)